MLVVLNQIEAVQTAKVQKQRKFRRKVSYCDCTVAVFFIVLVYRTTKHYVNTYGEQSDENSNLMRTVVSTRPEADVTAVFLLPIVDDTNETKTRRKEGKSHYLYTYGTGLSPRFKS